MCGYASELRLRSYILHMWSKLESIVKWFDWPRAHEIKAGWIVDSQKYINWLQKDWRNCLTRQTKGFTKQTVQDLSDKSIEQTGQNHFCHFWTVLKSFSSQTDLETGETSEEHHRQLSLEIRAHLSSLQLYTFLSPPPPQAGGCLSNKLQLYPTFQLPIWFSTLSFCNSDMKRWPYQSSSIGNRRICHLLFLPHVTSISSYPLAPFPLKLPTTTSIFYNLCSLQTGQNKIRFIKKLRFSCKRRPLEEL